MNNRLKQARTYAQLDLANIARVRAIGKVKEPYPSGSASAAIVAQPPFFRQNDRPYTHRAKSSLG